MSTPHSIDEEIMEISQSDLGTPPMASPGDDSSDPPRDEPPATRARTGRRAPVSSKARAGEQPNNVRKLRQEAMMSKAELARRAGISPLTVDRVESGCPCRMDTKRKILEALGLSPSARGQVWPDLED